MAIEPKQGAEVAQGPSGVGPADPIEQARDRLRSFIGRELLRGQDQGLRDDTPLLELGIVDSMGIVLLTTFLEKELGAVIPPEDITAENFGNITALANLVVRLRR